MLINAFCYQQSLTEYLNNAITNNRITQYSIPTTQYPITKKKASEIISNAFLIYPLAKMNDQ